MIVLIALIGSLTPHIAGAAERQTAVSSTTNVVLDISFSGDGIQTTDMGNDGLAYDVAIQEDGRIVVVGRASYDLAIARYNSDGSADTTFSGDGRLLNNTLADGRAVVLQDDGKIVVIGGEWPNDFYAMRFDTDGSVDSSFGSSGLVQTDFGNNDQAYDIAAQDDGKLVVVGTNNDFAVARYNSDGSLDTSFDSDGMQSTDFTRNDIAYAVALQDDGGIVVAGTTDTNNFNGADFALARYTSSGALDTSFDSDGKQTLNGGGDDRWYAVTVQDDGKIVAAGTNDSDFVVARYSSSGSLDSSFDSDGLQTIDFGGTDEAQDVVIQPDGKIIVAGFTDGQTMNLARLNSDGSLDTDFGTNGLITLKIDGSETEGYGVALQADDKIVTVGYKRDEFAVARYETLCLPDSVATESEWNAAIACFNSMTTPRTYAFALAADILFTQMPVTINNPIAGVELSVQGNNFSLDGQETAGVRPLTIAADTDVQIEDATIMGGKNPASTLSACSGSCGGGILNEGTLSLSNSFVRENEADFGSGILNVGGNLSFDSSGVVENSGYYAGLVNHDGGSVNITSSQITGNSSAAAFGVAGVVNSPNGIMVIDTSTISNNSGDDSGGVRNEGDLTITNSTISGNAAVSSFFNIPDSTAIVKNSTISGNTTGAAIFNHGTITLTHVTIANNHYSSGTKGYGFWNSGIGTASLYNSIMADNGQFDCIASAALMNEAYNVIETDSDTSPCAAGATTMTGIDPVLGVLQNNGGATETQTINSGSVAFDAIPVVNGSCNDTGITTDQRGETRPQESACDMGAYESIIPCLPAAVANEAQLNAAIACFNAETAAGSYMITLTADILLTASTIAIDNSTTGVELLVEGAGFAVDGQEIEGVRPFLILEDTTVTLQNIIVRNGKTVELGDSDGGGILNVEGVLTIKNSQILNNYANSQGGGIYNLGTLTVENTTFADNASSVEGAGIYATNGGTLVVEGSTFSNNSNTESGAAIAVEFINELYVNNSTFSGNRSHESGAAIFNHHSVATIENSTFVDNTGQIGSGSALNTGVSLCFTGDVEVLLADGSRKRIADVVVGDEVLSYDFAQGKQVSSRVEHLIHNETDSFLRLNDLEVTDEHPFAVGEDEWRTAAELEIGDRVLSEQGWTTITSKTRVFKEVEVYNLSVTGPHNYYVFDGEETYLVHNKNVAGNVGDMTLNNVIITNKAGVSGDYDCNSDGVAQFLGSNNLIDAHAAGPCSGISDAAVTNISLTLADNGGATQTHALLPGSNALEAGANCSDTDQRSVARPQNSTCDIGAYELWQLGIKADSAPVVTLSWGTAVSGCTYDVYESTAPYAPHTTPTYTDVDTDYDIASRLGDPDTNYFYISAETCNDVTVYSNEVGAFDFEIVPGG
ncbi:MAG: choice-of-anchor Q domain-containing protein [Chloroflexota bacterium]